MRLDKIDLSSVVAIGHSDGQLQVLIDRGEEMEYLELNAPFAAYQGLQQLAYIANNDISSFSDEETELPAEEEPIAMLPVRSTMASAIGYDEDREILQIEFNNGAVYQYSGVDCETWEELLDSDSIGKFYNSEIKGCYECDRVEDSTCWELEDD